MCSDVTVTFVAMVEPYSPHQSSRSHIDEGCKTQPLQQDELTAVSTKSGCLQSLACGYEWLVMCQQFLLLI